MRNTRRSICVFVLGVALLAAWGCATSAPVQTSIMAQEGVEISKRDLQIRIYSFAKYFTRTVEVASDEILAQSSDKEIRQRAIFWKINSVPYIQSAVFESHPLIGSIHVWMYCTLMTQYFRDGVGKDAFGEWQDIATEASEKLENEMSGLMQSLLPPGEFSRIQGDINSWAKENPILNPHIIPDATHADFVNLVPEIHVGSLAAAAEMNEAMHDMSDRMSVYAEAIPKQARWMTDLLMLQLPEMIAEERTNVMMDIRKESSVLMESLMDSVDEQVGPIFEMISKERLAILAAIQEERRFILGALRQERLETMDFVQSERIAIMGTIRAERIEILENFEILSSQMLNEVEARSLKLVDRIFLRMIQYFALPFIVLLMLAFFGARAINRTIQQSFQAKKIGTTE